MNNKMTGVGWFCAWNEISLSIGRVNTTRACGRKSKVGGSSIGDGVVMVGNRVKVTFSCDNRSHMNREVRFFDLGVISSVQ